MKEVWDRGETVREGMGVTTMRSWPSTSIYNLHWSVVTFCIEKLSSVVT